MSKFLGSTRYRYSETKNKSLFKVVKEADINPVNQAVQADGHSAAQFPLVFNPMDYFKNPMALKNTFVAPQVSAVVSAVKNSLSGSAGNASNLYNTGKISTSSHAVVQELATKSANLQYSVDSNALASQQTHLYVVGSSGFEKTFGSIDLYGRSTFSDNGSGIKSIWDDYRGAGVKVGIWDSGFDQTHPDLIANYNPNLMNAIGGVGFDPNIDLTTNMYAHGTAVAGIIAADDNNIGVVGIAPDSQFDMAVIFGTASQSNQYAQNYKDVSKFDITNHSYEWIGNTFQVFNLANKDTSAADSMLYNFANSGMYGRGGLGTINLMAMSNSSSNANDDFTRNNRFEISVGALTFFSQSEASGTSSYTTKAASYSAYGSNMLVTAAVATVTTDVVSSTVAGETGLDWTNTNKSVSVNDYTNKFSGTSSSTPVVSGVVALMLDANAGLGARDVQNILVYSSTGTGSLYNINKTLASNNENFGWQDNGATNWNGGALHFSEDYGYGSVNAYQAVRMAEIWDDVYGAAQTFRNEINTKNIKSTVNASIANTAKNTYSFNVATGIDLEHVQLKMNITHPNFLDLHVYLTSPSGTRMMLLDGSNTDVSKTMAANGYEFSFGVEGYRGENSLGRWTIEIEDRNLTDNATGMFNHFTITGYGSNATDNDVFHYTDEVFASLALDASRLTLQDGLGTDWVEAASMTGNLNINLNAGNKSTSNGLTFMQLGSATLIENAVTGDGQDTITGNSSNNKLMGMRGNDAIFANAGNDTLIGGLGIDTLSGGDGADWFVYDQLDVLTSYDRIKDFSRAQGDKIVFDDSIFTALKSGLSDASGLHPTAGSVLTFVAGATITADTRLIYNASNGGLFYDVDGSGAQKSVVVAQFSDMRPTELTASDFLII